MGLGQFFGGVLWLMGGLILPQISPVDTRLVPIVVGALWGVTAVGYWVSRRTPMLDDVQAISMVLLDELFTRFDELAEQFGVNKVKTIGDAYMAVAGAPDPVSDHALRVVRLGSAMLEATERYSEERGLPLRPRVGVNSGPIVAGVIGRKRFSYDLWGDTVNVASRMESQGLEGRVQMGEATWRLVRDEIPCEARGEIEVKGKGLMRTYLVVHVPHEPGSAAGPSPAGTVALEETAPIETAPSAV